ncbi:MFS transporter [Gordonia zhenghanii]|uniref:MFS transporter n=1 Tax=Gordonia zhenghanii TaxID=2911516 RepID=UPI0027DEEF96|nr:MFS transporter [Gordonia zhenghanii]
MNRAAVAATAFAFLIAMVGTTIPTALYPIYADDLGFSSLTVTVLFAVYACGVFVALLLFGTLSDQIGRRPVLVASLAFAIVSAAVFLAPASLTTLVSGRVLSGVSAGLMTGAGTAAIVDLFPSERRARAGALAVAANSGGLGIGNLMGGVIADVSSSPLVVPFVAHLVLAALALVGMHRYGQAPGPRRGWRLRIQRLRVPTEIRGAFTRGSLAAGAGFASSGVLTAVTGLFLANDLDLHAHWLTGFVVFLVFASVASGQLLARRIPQRTALPAACAGMVVASGFLAWALAGPALGPLIVSAVCVGVSCGVSMNVALATTVELVPTAFRGGVSSAFFTVIYIMLAFPAIGVGVAADSLGLRDAGLIFAGLVAVLAGAVGLAEYSHSRVRR